MKSLDLGHFIDQSFRTKTMEKERGMEMKEKILDFIISYIEIHCYPPTIREIADGVGLKSTNSVLNNMKQLQMLGLLEADAPVKGSSRAIRVVGYKFVKTNLKANSGKQNCCR